MGCAFNPLKENHASRISFGAHGSGFGFTVELSRYLHKN